MKRRGNLYFPNRQPKTFSSKKEGLLIKSHYVQGIINAYAKGTTIQHAGEAIKHMNSILPPQNLMDLFDEITNPAFNEILILLDQNQKLAQAWDLLLPRLMSGEIEV